MRRRVLFVCIHNSARSQMAEAFLRRMCADELEAASAGLEPTSINPLVVDVMKEVGSCSRGAQRFAGCLRRTRARRNTRAKRPHSPGMTAALDRLDELRRGRDAIPVLHRQGRSR